MQYYGQHFLPLRTYLCMLPFIYPGAVWFVKITGFNRLETGSGVLQRGPGSEFTVKKVFWIS